MELPSPCSVCWDQEAAQSNPLEFGKLMMRPPVGKEVDLPVHIQFTYLVFL